MVIDIGSKEDREGKTLLNKVLLKTETSSSREQGYFVAGAKGF
jgi:hypothetical protein